MTAPSKMLQSKISKTKKRLSRNDWSLPIVLVALLAVCYVAVSSYRGLTLGFAYGTVTAEIPVLMGAIEDKTYHRFKERPSAKLSADTAAVILTQDGDFYLGSMASFTTGYHQARNKFFVPHREGQPQTADLVETVSKWMAQRQRNSVRNDKLLVLVPASTAPVAIVTQVTAALKSTTFFDRVILANGLY